MSWDWQREGGGGVSDGDREERRDTTVVVVHFRDLPPISHFPPPSAFFFVERDRNGPTSLRRGEGRLRVDGPGGEPVGAMGVDGGGGRRRKMKPTSTVATVDVSFKLRSHAQ